MANLRERKYSKRVYLVINPTWIRLPGTVLVDLASGPLTIDRNAAGAFNQLALGRLGAHQDCLFQAVCGIGRSN